MKQYSLWASLHPIQARWLIAVAHLFLFVLAIIAGWLWWLNDVAYGSLTHDIFTTLFLLGVIFYPVRGATHLLWRHSYRRQKIFDFVVVITGFLSLAAMTGIKLEQATLSTSNAYALKTASSMPEEKLSQRSLWKELLSWRSLVKKAKVLKKELREAKKLWKQNGDNVVGEVLLTLLIIIIAVLLAILIMMWACHLSCSGQEGAANAVLIGGGGVLIVLTILGIRAVWRRKR